MLKPLSILSVSTVALLTSSSAFSHVICAPDTPQSRVAGHTHNQAYTVPRIVQPAAYSPNQAQYLQQQRARQQKALANQNRINQQRRAQALQKQQQIATQKARQIQLQRLAAQQAQKARQQAAMARARQAKLQQQLARYTPPVVQPRQVVRYTQAVVQQRYVQPTYVQPVVYYQQEPAPVYYAPQRPTYVPAHAYVSVSVGGGSGSDYGDGGNYRSHQVSKPVPHIPAVKHYPRQKSAAQQHQSKRYNHAGSAQGRYPVSGNGGDRSRHNAGKRQDSGEYIAWSGRGHSNNQQVHYGSVKQ